MSCGPLGFPRLACYKGRPWGVLTKVYERMRLLRDATDRRRAIKLAFVLALAGAAAGCDTQAGRDASDSTIGAFRMLVGAGEEPDELPVDAGAPPPPTEAKCPPVVIREGTETFRVYARGHEGDPDYVVYQGGITKTARECEFVGTNAIRIKLGIAGKVVTGPAWNDTSVQLPLRAAFVRTGGEGVWSQLYPVQPNILPGETVQQFTQVDDSLYFEVPEGDHINNYVIYIGFDEMGGKPKRG